MSRNLVIAVGVVLLHLGGLWALQNGLLRRAIAVFVPVVVVSEVVPPLLPEASPPPPPPRVPPPPTVTKQAAKRQAPAPQPAPQLRAVPNPDPAPNAPVAAPPPPGPLPPLAAPVVVSEAPVAGPAALPSTGQSVEMPSSDAQYLQNPKPTYPPMSRRLGEQGTVLVQVLIGVDGNAQKGEIKKSSGFSRLDQAALATVLKWRYVPGKRAGVAEAMWFTVPIAFALE